MSVPLSRILQAAFLVGLLVIAGGMAMTAHENLLRQGVSTGFAFLLERTGWDVSAAFVPHAPDDPYWWTFLVGLCNTLALSIVCIVLSTAAGMVLALLGAGRSRILYGLTRGYVWIFRNVPLIVQVFFWYHVTRQLPPVRQAEQLLGCCYASNRGVYIPRLGVDFTPAAWGALLVTAALVAAGLRAFNAARRAGGERVLPSAAVVGATGVLAGVAALAAADLTITTPRLQGFNFADGVQLSPEFIALVVAIVAYNVAFIAEIINSGIRAIPANQLEAARIIGLSHQRTFWTITVPQAIRTAVPPLINQYISLTKSSSLAIAIGYTDLFSVGVIAINHTGQSINVIAVLMLVYLAISFGISALGNLYNRTIVLRRAA